MMFLEKLWKGDIAPGAERYRPNKEYAKGLQTMEQCELHLKEHLSADDWKIFQKFTDAAEEVDCLAQCDNFIDGFRIGAMVMMEILMGYRLT